MAKGGRIFSKLARAIVIAALAGLVAGAALEFLAPREPLRRLCVRNLQEKLGRQVKLAAVAIGPWRGARLEGLEISEAPDFAAGTFFRADRVVLRPRFWPLLAGRLALSRVELVEPRLRLACGTDGRCNYNALFEKRAAAPSAARFNAAAFFTKDWDNPGKKLGQLGALAAGAGTAASRGPAGLVSRLRVDIEQLRVRRGVVEYADAAGRVQLTGSDIAVWAEGLAAGGARAEVQMEGKAAGTVRDGPASAEFVADARMELDRAWQPVASAGHLILNKIAHPQFQTDHARLEWDLKELTPELTVAMGAVKLEGSAGSLFNPALLAGQGKWLSLLLYPVQALAKSSGLVKDMTTIEYGELRGEYALQNGVLRLSSFSLKGPALSMTSDGALQLAPPTAGLKASVIMGGKTLVFAIQGPLDAPSIEQEGGVVEPPKKKPRAARSRAVVKRRPAAVKTRPAVVETSPAVVQTSSAVVNTPPAAPKAAKKHDVLQQIYEESERSADDEARAARGESPKAPSSEETLKDAEGLIDAPLPK